MTTPRILLPLPAKTFRNISECESGGLSFAGRSEMENKSWVRRRWLLAGMTLLLVLSACSMASRGPAHDATMQLLMDQWSQSDGDARFVAADRLSKFLVEQPEAFLRGFASRPEDFKIWLESLSGTTFRDFGGTYAERVALRQQMLNALGRVSRPELQTPRARALAMIRSTPVTSVN